LRCLFGLTVVQVDDALSTAAAEKLQFRLWQMLLGMTIIAVVLGIGRGLYQWILAWSPSPYVDDELIVLFTLFTGFNLLLAWPMLWAILASTKNSTARVFVSVALAAIVTLVEYPVFVGVLPVVQPPPLVFWIINVPQVLCLAAHLIATRSGGLCLVRTRRAPPNPAVAADVGPPCEP
jgi:hypothetical protein